MSQKSAVIQCRKCGYVSNIINDTCIICGSGLERVCNDCGFANPMDNEYCARCRTPLIVISPPPSPPANETIFENSFKLELQPIQDTVEERAASFSNRRSDAPAPAARQEQPVPPPPGKFRSPPRPNAAKKISGAIMIAGLLGILGFILYLIMAPYFPGLSLRMAANLYLKRLSAGRYEEAYAMLSTNSKSACSMKNFVEYGRQYYGAVPSWKFRGVEVFDIKPEAAMARYELKEGTGPWRTDYISFVKEHGRWTRPYIWMLFEPIDTALARQDYPLALFLAQRLYLTDPMDPRASGYLCVSEFFMGLYSNAVDSCAKTIVSASTYPVGFSAEEVFWFKFYYADSLRLVQKLDLALDAYGKLLKYPDISPRTQCTLFLSRADAYVKLNKYNSALDDVLNADEVCEDAANLLEAAARMRFLNGEARADAISFAQRTKSGQNMPSFGELRRKELASAAALPGRANTRYTPKDIWTAEHLTGPEYRVALRQESIDPKTGQKDIQNVYAFKVNLWTGVIRLEDGTPPKNQYAVQK